MFQQLQGKSVLITGANGFIGAYLASGLHAAGARVAGFGMPGLPFPADVTAYTGDLRDGSVVQNCVDSVRPEYVFHLAAFKERTARLEAFQEALEINVMGSLNLFRALEATGTVKGAVVVGTAEEYGLNPAPFVETMREVPVTAYSLSKLCVTNLCQLLHRLYEFPVCVVRPTLAYGPGQSGDMFLPALITAMINGQRFPMTAGQQTRDYLYVTDIVDALMRSVLTPAAFGTVLNIGSGESITLSDLARNVERMVNRDGLVEIGAVDYRRSEVMQYAVSTKKAVDVLGWRAQVPMQEGLKTTIDYYRKVAAAGH